MASPIEHLIDKACGITSENVSSSDWITLRCPKCKLRKRAKRDETDPPGTVIIVLQCPECNGGDFDSPVYFDEAGNELPFIEAEL